MRGITRSLSLRRRLICDMMHAAAGVPFVTVRRTLAIGPLVEARRKAANPPGWAAIFSKAFGLVARDEPALRTMYLHWPWPRLYELPCSIGAIAVARRDSAEASVLPVKLGSPETRPLSESDRIIRNAREAAVENVPTFRKLLRISALPLPLRRLLWAIGTNSGRQRGNFVGSFGLSSVAAFGAGELWALSPGPFLLSYTRATSDGAIDVVMRWDHRVTDGETIARALARLELVLNNQIAAEVLA